MNDLLNDDDAPLARNERELTLSTGTILGIFLGLVVLCGACFGIGYNMGHKAAPAPLAINDNLGNENLADAGAGAKPPAGSPAETGVTNPVPTVVATPAPTPAPKSAPIVRRPPPPTPATAEDTPETPAPTPRATTTAAGSPAVRNVPPSALMPSASTPAGPGAGSIMVQVAAVSHQDDANLLLGALRARGYTVSARPSGADGFIHVQVGPFSNKKDAEAMRQRLISDGYNAILK